MEKVDILSMTKEELTAFIISLGEPKFRAKQVHEWLMRGADFSEMTNLSAALREKLASEYTLTKNAPASNQKGEETIWNSSTTIRE